MAGDGHRHDLVLEQLGAKVQASCSCGWRANGRDSSRRAAGQAWSAHLYARGFRTSSEIESACRTRP